MQGYNYTFILIRVSQLDISLSVALPDNSRPYIISTLSSTKLLIISSLAVIFSPL